MQQGPDSDILLNLKKLDLRSHFGGALRAARVAKGLSQEAFDTVSSRTYVSSLERGQKSPTLDKVAQLASVLGLHPLTLHAYTFLRDPTPEERIVLLRTIRAQLRQLLEHEAARRNR
ncbi:helix-turn-helix transcriptional regulator [Cupriavidus gilardii]|uniref:helix-turn-helix domain-containing protein n=1 Tax=Cupriavidus gilardii TaxID=82541 RepID=UPI001ABE83FE|nr:helix-turn-helix transcriptional regulator [Cupriavidus gilardii]MBO4122713.1 helix-turn-helix transcriptional regulator [Cupriavidus gilardii]